MDPPFTDCSSHVVTTRGGVIENTHLIHVAVTSVIGDILYSTGDPRRVTLVRSAAKPVQALAIVNTGALEEFEFDDQDLALMCASHSAEGGHIEKAQLMLGKIGAREEDLRCGGHPSILPAIATRWIQEGFVPGRVYNNCSGKHIGMLAGAKTIGAPFKDYQMLEHPIQQRVKAAVEDLADLAESEVTWGVDGCNMPAPAYPLKNLARTFAVFAQSADLASTDAGSVSPTVAAQARIFGAMSSYPFFVAGSRRFCTALMQEFRGQLIGKVGADGCYAIGVRESARTRQLGADGALGIAVKVEDGNPDILHAAVVEILEQLGILKGEPMEDLACFHRPRFENTMGIEIGGIEFRFRLKRL